MRRCPHCKLDARTGSKFCPRCGGVMDDGLNVDGQRVVIWIAMLVGVVSLLLFLGMFGLRIG